MVKPPLRYAWIQQLHLHPNAWLGHSCPPQWSWIFQNRWVKNWHLQDSQNINHNKKKYVGSINIYIPIPNYWQLRSYGCNLSKGHWGLCLSCLGGKPSPLKTHHTSLTNESQVTPVPISMARCMDAKAWCVLGGSFEDLGEPFPSFSTFRKKIWRNIELLSPDNPPPPQKKNKLWKCREVLFFFLFRSLICWDVAQSQRTCVLNLVDMMDVIRVGLLNCIKSSSD